MKLIVTEKDNRILSLLFDEKCLCDIKVSPAQGSILGNIYRARVSKIVKHMDACFVDIEKGRSCFLKFSECEDIIPREGEELTVMVTEDAIKTKAPAVSMRLSVSGMYMIMYMNKPGRVSVSKKITSRHERDRLKKIFDLQMLDNLGLGLVVRTCAQGVSYDELTKEFDRLMDMISKIKEFGKTRTLYSVLYRARPKYIDDLITYLAIDELEIVTDSTVIKNDISSFTGRSVRLYSDEKVSLYSLYSIEARVQEVLAKKVYLKSGGYLVIEQTEALNVIDVNSGKFERKKSSGEFYSMTNREAAVEAARQIRLRNLSGIIIIDFINEASADSRDELISIMNDEFRHDSCHAKVVDITALGLMEITRKKISPSLKEIFFTTFN